MIALERAAALPSAKPDSFRRQVLRRFTRSRMGITGLAVTLIFISIGLLAPALANENPLVCKYDGKIYAPAIKDLLHANLPYVGKMLFPHSAPFHLVTFNFKKRMNSERGDWVLWTPVPHGELKTSEHNLAAPSRSHWLGTDEVGRDVLARMIHGARVSMMVGFISVGISTTIGLLLGALAGYFAGWVDILISRLIEVVMCFPVFFLILTILAIDPRPSIWKVMIVIGITTWTGAARYVRGEFIRLRDSEYSIAARALGARPLRIILRHLLPNALAPLFVTVTFGIAAAILLESALSYLGVGVQPPQPSWGNILQSGFANMMTATHMIYPPAIAIFLGVLSYNLVGDALRDAVDPRLART
ncbi:MAG: ABC transporter permease [Planctomycetes bacterium]|nr:ABC transporter permease [Planctomycetota bacterium]